MLKKLAKVQKTINPLKLQDREVNLKGYQKLVNQIAKEKIKFEKREALIKEEEQRVSRKLDELFKPSRPRRPLQLEQHLSENSSDEPSDQINEDLPQIDDVSESIRTEIDIACSDAASDGSIDEDIQEMHDSFTSLKVASSHSAIERDRFADSMISAKNDIASVNQVPAKNASLFLEVNQLYEDDFEGESCNISKVNDYDCEADSSSRSSNHHEAIELEAKITALQSHLKQKQNILKKAEKQKTFESMKRLEAELRSKLIAVDFEINKSNKSQEECMKSLAAENFVDAEIIIQNPEILKRSNSASNHQDTDEKNSWNTKIYVEESKSPKVDETILLITVEDHTTPKLIPKLLQHPKNTSVVGENHQESNINSPYLDPDEEFNQEESYNTPIRSLKALHTGQTKDSISQNINQLENSITHDIIRVVATDTLLPLPLLPERDAHQKGRIGEQFVSEFIRAEAGDEEIEECIDVEKYSDSFEDDDVISKSSTSSKELQNDSDHAIENPLPEGPQKNITTNLFSERSVDIQLAPLNGEVFAAEEKNPTENKEVTLDVAPTQIRAKKNKPPPLLLSSINHNDASVYSPAIVECEIVRPKDNVKDISCIVSDAQQAVITNLQSLLNEPTYNSEPVVEDKLVEGLDIEKDGVFETMVMLLAACIQESLANMFKPHRDYLHPNRHLLQKQPLTPRPIPVSTIFLRLESNIHKANLYSNMYGEDQDLMLKEETANEVVTLFNFEPLAIELLLAVEEQLWEELIEDCAIAVNLVAPII